jgi:hypothetical protein
MSESRPDDVTLPDDDETPPRHGVSRRSVAFGAAWSVPVLVLAVSTPAFAASANAMLSISSSPGPAVPAGGVFDPLQTLVTLGGVAQSGTVVTYTVTSGPALFGGTSTTATATTGSDGLATVLGLTTIGTSEGPVTVVASAPGMTSVTFNLVVAKLNVTLAFSSNFGDGGLNGGGSSGDGGVTWRGRSTWSLVVSPSLPSGTVIPPGYHFIVTFASNVTLYSPQVLASAGWTATQTDATTWDFVSSGTLLTSIDVGGNSLVDMGDMETVNMPDQEFFWPTNVVKIAAPTGTAQYNFS